MEHFKRLLTRLSVTRNNI